MLNLVNNRVYYNMRTHIIRTPAIILIFNTIFFLIQKLPIAIYITKNFFFFSFFSIIILLKIIPW